MKADEHLDALFKVGSDRSARKARRKDRQQKLAAKIEAHEAELKREKLRVIAQNKQRLASKPEQNLLHIGWRAKVRCAVKDKNRFAMSGWFELFRGKSSIYALDEVSKKWVDRGISGQVIMFQNQQFRTDIRIKWSKNQRYPIWWRLMNGKPKPKGEHWDTQTWVLKAWDTQTNKQEILAIRFSDVQLSQQFSVKFHKLQMSLAKQGIFNVGASVPDRKGTGSGVNSLGV